MAHILKLLIRFYCLQEISSMIVGLIFDAQKFKELYYYKKDSL